ncbi:MAG TPA: serine hydrolase [Alphaproteobacteria bacterium]|nr:serine hydrolase [Alphaproteobacteria bacterium]
MSLLRRLALLLVLACSCFAGPALAAEVPGAAWPVIAPKAAGWSESDLAKAQSYSEDIGSSAVVIVQHGRIVAAWGDIARPIELHSVRKSFLNALIGIAVKDGKIEPSATLAELGIDDNPPSLTPEEKGARVIDLLRARSGVYHPALYETAAMAAQRPPRGSHAPGTFWYYNNWDFNTLGIIYERATGASIFEEFDRLIAKPIGMEDYRPSDGRYVTGSASLMRAYPFHMSARDLARFALLYLDGGRWGERQIVPEEWVKESTAPYSESAFGPHYGMLWWTGPLAAGHGNLMPLPAGSYFALGYGGQYAFVLPPLDMVVVHVMDRDGPGRELPMHEMARLLWLLLHAAGSKEMPAEPPF